MKGTYIFNQLYFMNEDITFFQEDHLLKNVPGYNYPQYVKLTEEKFLTDVGIERNETLDVITSLDIFDFSKAGDYPVVVVLYNKKTKRYMSKIIKLTILPFTRSVADLRNIYWRRYGLVLEGQLDHSKLRSTQKRKYNYVMEIKNVQKQTLISSPLCLNNWSFSQHKDSFQTVFVNSTFESLEIGDYVLDVKIEENTIESTFDNLEKEEKPLLSVYDPELSSIGESKLHIINDKTIQIDIGIKGEFFLKIRKG